MKKLTLFWLCLMILLVGCTEQKLEPTSSSINEFTFDTSGFSHYANISNEAIWDLCPFMDTQLTYMLLTKEPLEQNSAVALMITNSCEYSHTACNDEWMVEFPFWLYQTYRGLDWNAVARVAEAAQSGDPDAQRKLKEYETLFLEDYEALTAADLPQIYGYWVTNNVTTEDYNTGSTAARYEEIPLTICNEELEINVGTLNIYRQGLDEYLASEEVDRDIYIGRLAYAYPTYWGDGKVTVAPIVIKEQDYPQTLTALEIYGIEAEILDIQVSFNGNTQDWDGAISLEIPADTTASIVVTLQTQANQTVGYCEDANLVVQRDTNGQTQRLWYFTSISQSWNIYELYAMMVDGLDISAYYAYSTGWEKPDGIREPQSNMICFDEVTVANTDQYNMCVTGASWDNHAYSLHLSAANHSEEAIELNLGNVYLNGWDFGREYTIQLEPSESGEFLWHIPWETMVECGIYAQSGDEVYSIEFIFNPLYDGMLPTDENGHFIMNEAYTCIYPQGTDVVTCVPTQGSMVLETEKIRLYAVQFGRQSYSCLSSETHPSPYYISFVMENISESSVSYLVTDFCINNVQVEAIGADVFRGGSSCFSTVPIYLTDTNAHNIGEPEVLTFLLTLNNNDSYTVTIDLLQELEE